MKPVRWACGVTTVPDRATTLLPRTLRSLHAAGFDDLRLFVDDCRHPFHDMDYERFCCPVTNRYPRIGAWGNWLLGLTELWVRSPGCDYYAMFQDDLVCVRGLCEYLIPELDARSVGAFYFNLYTVQQNEELAKGKRGFYLSNQMGRGALALIFPRDAVGALLQDREVVSKPNHCNRPDSKIDGTVSGAMKRAGYLEIVHYPSLVEHTGVESMIGHNIGPAYRSAPSFPGEEWNPLEGSA